MDFLVGDKTFHRALTAIAKLKREIKIRLKKKQLPTENLITKRT